MTGGAAVGEGPGAGRGRAGVRFNPSAGAQGGHGMDLAGVRRGGYGIIIMGRTDPSSCRQERLYGTGSLLCSLLDGVVSMCGWTCVLPWKEHEQKVVSTAGGKVARRDVLRANPRLAPNPISEK